MSKTHTHLSRPKKYITTCSKCGLTLIEMSIALVIIGLVVGGLFAGREIINSAKIRGHVSEIQKLDAALNSFRLKYNCFAGDCSAAASFGLNSGGAPFSFISNNDSVLSYNWPIIEGGWVFIHLYNAALWPYNSVQGGAFPNGSFNCWGPSTNCRSVPLGGKTSLRISIIEGQQLSSYPAQAPAAGFYFFVSDVAGTNSPAFLPVDLFTIDEKMDDGVPYAGKVQVMGYGPGNGGIMSLVPSGGTPYYPNCVNTGTTPPSYQSSYTTAACIAGFKIGGYGNYYGP